MVLLAGFLFLTGTHDTVAQGFTYQFIHHSLVPLSLGDVAWGDLDRDGDMDLVVTGRVRADVETIVTTTYLNQGVIGSVDGRGDSLWTQQYLVQGRGLTPAWLSDVAWVDFDNDGVLEFVVAGATNLDRPYNPVTMLYKLTGSEFAVIDRNVEGFFGGSVDWGDYDNDGDADLLITGETDHGFASRIFENVDGTLQDSGIRMLDVSLGDGRFGDFDNDGDLDVVLTGDTGTGFKTSLFRNDNGNMVEIASDFDGLAFSTLDWGDFDNDGDLDLLVAGGILSPLILEGQAAVYRNDGDGVFTDINADLDGTFYGAATWGDYDNDGLIDILLTGASNLQEQRLGRLYKNEGDGTFRFSTNLAGLLFSSVGLGDYDYDGDLDIIEIGDGVTNQYRNDHLRLNTPPSAPENLTAEVIDGGAVLSWSPATDSDTDAPGLSYNIRVGSDPDAIDVVSPNAVVETGRRLISQLGNVQQNTSWVIRDMTPGTYFWSVQAIDNAFNGSTFANEGSFVVTTSGNVSTAAESDETPGNFELVSNFPNPFATSTTIEYRLASPQFVEATVFNMLGERVATLQSDLASAGTHRLTWNGTTLKGDDAGAGVYLLRLNAGSESRTIRIVRVL